MKEGVVARLELPCGGNRCLLAEKRGGAASGKSVFSAVFIPERRDFKFFLVKRPGKVK